MYHKQAILNAENNFVGSLQHDNHWLFIEITLDFYALHFKFYLNGFNPAK